MSSRHAAWYADLAERANEQLQGPDEADWLDRLENELGNLRAALAWFERTRAAAAFQTLGAALLSLWDERGHWREGEVWLVKALALADSDARTRVRALIALCELLGYRNSAAEMRPLALEIDRLSTKLDDTTTRARALTLLGWVALADNDLDEAQRMHEQAVPLARASGDRWSLTRALNELGNVLLIRGEFDAAAGTLAEALAISREVGFPDATGRVLTNLGLAVLSRGDAEKAAEHLSEALTLFATTKSSAAWAALLGLAAVANTNDDPRRAARLLGASNHVAEEVGLSREAYEAGLYQDTLAGVRASLGDQATAQLFAEGEKMPRNEAIAYALEQPE